MIELKDKDDDYDQIERWGSLFKIKLKDKKGKLWPNWRTRKVSYDQSEGKGSKSMIHMEETEAKLWSNWRIRKTDNDQFEGQGSWTIAL